MPDPNVWTIPANGIATVSETYGFKTQLIEAYSGFEQRQKLRSVSLESIEFSILAEDRAAELAQTLIYAGHDESLAVPLWQYGSRLTGNISIGASLLPIADALDVPYRRSSENLGLALVWQDEFTWELFSVSSTSGSGVATSDTATLGWTAGAALVYPARLARFDGDPEHRWLTTRVLEGRIKFTGDPT